MGRSSALQTSNTFIPTKSFHNCVSSSALVELLDKHAIRYRESSKSICLLGNDALRAFSEDLFDYYKALISDPLCLKISKSSDFIADDDVNYVWDIGLPTHKKRKQRNRRIGSVRSKLPIGNILSLYGITPRIFDACVLNFPTGLRMVAQLCHYYPEVVKDKTRTRKLMSRMLPALEAEQIEIVSRFGLKDPDFTHLNNNFCGRQELRYVDTQKFVFKELSGRIRRLDRVIDAQTRAGTEPWLSDADRFYETFLATPETNGDAISDAIVVEIGDNAASTCQTMLSQGARWYFGITASDRLETEKRLLFYKGFSRFTLLAKTDFEINQNTIPAEVDLVVWRNPFDQSLFEKLARTICWSKLVVVSFENNIQQLANTIQQTLAYYCPRPSVPTLCKYNIEKASVAKQGVLFFTRDEMKR